MVDGDKALVVADPFFISIAERNMNGILPLYYNMKKASPTLLNNKTIYEGLNSAFTSGNIGTYSNNISKIWNSDTFVNGTEEEKQQAIECVKLLCMENNFCIDYAKTLFMPKRPDWFKERVSSYTNEKLPAFFEFAKDKRPDQVKVRNQSFVNKLYCNIPDKPINTRSLKLGTLDYKVLMSNQDTVCHEDVSELYSKISKDYSYKVNMKDEYIHNMRFIACSIRGQFNELGYDDETITDMLVQKIYGGNSRRKQLLWFCYGKYIFKNILKNVPPPKVKTIQCVDCGDWFEVSSTNNRTCRCPICQKIYNRHLKTEKQKLYRK